MRRVTVRGLLTRKLRLALTALAIVAGVMFVSGTLILTDTLHHTFDALVGNVYSKIDFQIRGDATLGKGAYSGADSTTDRKPIPQSIAAAVRRLPGVAYVNGSVEGYAQFVQGASNDIGNGGPSALGFSFDPNKQLSVLHLAAGRPPTNAHDVVMDKETATKYHFRVGERVRVLLTGPSQTFTITGIVTFGGDNDLVGDTLAGFYLPTAQALFNTRGYYDAIDVLSKPGADRARLRRAIEKILPRGVQVVSGQTVVNEETNLINSDLSFFSTALLVFAFISLFVGGFTIVNTFAITVGQRTRELALLRVVGASRLQLFRSVLGEAALTGAVASLIGLGLGVLAALGLVALLKAFGITLPAAPLVFKSRTAVVAIAVGVGVTVVSAIGPARRAVRIPPVAALVDHREDQDESLRGRAIAGSLVALCGLCAVLAGVSKPAILLVGLGALAVFIGMGMLAPLVARPLAGALGRPLASALGAAAKLGRENSMRSPRRTAQTAAALMVGLALVSTIAVWGASEAKTATSDVDSAVNANYIIGGTVSGSTVPAISRMAGVTAVTTVYSGQFAFRGALSTVGAVSAADLPQTVNLVMTAGRGAPALAAGELLIDATTANADHLSVGSTVSVTFAQTGQETMRIGGIFKPNPLIGHYLVGAGFFVSHFHAPLPVALLVRTTPGAASRVGRALHRAFNPYPVSVQTRAQFERQQQTNINQLVDLVYALLALAIIVALIGVVNTLMLSVFERTHEIGLLRAVGMKRRQVRSMIRSESVIIALFGAVVGVIIGTGLGVAMVSSLRQQGINDIVIPFSNLVVFLILAGLLGLVAASWPARRAAKLDVLDAIAAE
jgi:putative ABC transport system permease protein